jgi:hypothetical protein
VPFYYYDHVCTAKDLKPFKEDTFTWILAHGWKLVHSHLDNQLEMALPVPRLVLLSSLLEEHLSRCSNWNVLTRERQCPGLSIHAKACHGIASLVA